MAIAFDAQVTNFNNGVVRPASQTFSHTCTGDDRFLIVQVINSVGTGIITGVTYGGVSMTEVDRYSATYFAKEMIVYVLTNPASGSNTVSIQTTGSGTVAIYTAVASYTGVDQTTPNPHNAKNTGTATSLTLTINTSSSPSTDNCWIVCGSLTDGNYISSAGAGTTKRSTGTVDDWVGIYDNNIAITPAGSDSLVTNISTSSAIYMIGVSLAPAGGAGANTTNFFYMM